MRLLPLATLLAAATLSAQTHPAKHTTPHPEPEKTTSLPVTSVSLYKNGVGFFEHTGHVSGNASVSIDFTSSQLNDVLQSLTAIDLNGGRISGADYNSTTPLDQQLRTLPIALGEDPTASQFYASIRGARVEVRTPAASISGRLLSIETRPAPTTDNNAIPQPDRLFLTVVSDTGDSRTLEITSATTVHLLDPSLQQNVNRYLQLLDSTRSQGLRHLTLEDLGSAPNRELHVSYISEVPVWKSTYRILFTESHDPGAPGPDSGTRVHTATLQGWSVVDNTTGADWINVHLSLIAGAPQSFIQPLSQPLYTRRPEIPIAEEAQLTPQTFDSGIDGRNLASFAQLSPGATSDSVEVTAAAPQVEMKARNFGVMGGMAGGFGSGPRDRFSGGGLENLGTGPMNGLTYQEQASASITPAATAAAFDDFFQYKLTDPVTILKNQSALVPILQSKIDADRVTLVSYNSGRIAQPLRALWITNTSGLTLDRGSFSIVEDGNFGGEGLLDPIHPGEKRLLSYAADQAVHVSTTNDDITNHITLIRGSKGVVNIHRADVHDIVFTLHNSAADRRSVVLELPVAGGFKITSDPQPTETTPTVYRFRVDVDPGQTVPLHIAGERKGYTTYYLTRSNDDQLQFLLNTTNHNPTLEAALQPILEARQKVADAEQAVAATRQTLDQLHADEDRQRANITALANADKTSRDRFVHDLNTTEDKITAAQSELLTRNQTLDTTRNNLSTAIEACSIDEKVTQ